MSIFHQINRDLGITAVEISRRFGKLSVVLVLCMFVAKFGKKDMLIIKKGEEQDEEQRNTSLFKKREKGKDVEIFLENTCLCLEKNKSFKPIL